MDWSPVLNLNDVNASVQKFMEVLLPVIENHAPYKMINGREKGAEWVSDDLLGLIDAREHLKREYNKNPTELNYMLKEDAIKEVKRSRRTLQRNYVRDAITEAGYDSSKMWKCLKRIWPTKSKKNKISQINNTSNPIEMAEILNEFFSSIGEKLSKDFESIDHNNTPMQAARPPIFEFKLASYADVESAIHSLSASRSCGIDGLTSKLIKDARECIIIPLLHIFNLSIKYKTFPTSWKTGIVTPIYKEGSKTDPSNYRPITILNTPSKILERIIHNQLNCY